MSDNGIAKHESAPVYLIYACLSVSTITAATLLALVLYWNLPSLPLSVAIRMHTINWESIFGHACCIGGMRSIQINIGSNDAGKNADDYPYNDNYCERVEFVLVSMHPISHHGASFVSESDSVGMQQQVLFDRHGDDTVQFTGQFTDIAQGSWVVSAEGGEFGSAAVLYYTPSPTQVQLKQGEISHVHLDLVHMCPQ